MCCGVARESLRLGAALTLAQETAMRRVRSRAAEFAQQPFDIVFVASLADAVATSSVDCSGGPLTRAPPCVLAELAPGLPKRGHAATLNAIDFVDDEAARWLADPAPARANVGSQFEWGALAMHRVDLGVFTVLPAEELVHVRGEPLLNGLFAVEKKGAPGPGASRVARPSLNMAPGNALIEPIVGEAAMLAGSTSWAEWRKGAPRPVAATAEERGAAWRQVYIDDFDAPEIVEEVRARRLIGLLAEMQVRARASYDRAGVAYSAEKARCRQLRVEGVGADVDGESGRLAAPLAKSLEAIALCLASFRLEAVPWRLAMTILGRFVGLFEFRRPFFSVLGEAAMLEELLAAMLVMPMAATSLLAKIEGMAAVSGASESGGGARASVGLRAEAEASLCSASTLDEQMHLGARVLQLPAEPSEPWAVTNPLVPRAVVLRAPKVLLVGLFDGIGGSEVAFLRLPVRAVGYVAAGADAEARRVARLRRPGAIDCGDVARVTAAVVNELRGAYCDEVGIFAAAAGSPCLYLARLNASGAGLRGAKSSLFYDAPRLLVLLRAAFGHGLKWFVENFASMTGGAPD
ncbi:unnamed protein product [Prorocentrum cordatum]|uniref:Uncharacterized protein n=1 Tax=Prorocentrum cordatum TaxID=2364126 RepID=A0ABN9RVW6_9DINO|nr:unnamed protein product [Polarella glacialis]